MNHKLWSLDKLSWRALFAWVDSELSSGATCKCYWCSSERCEPLEQFRRYISRMIRGASGDGERLSVDRRWTKNECKRKSISLNALKRRCINRVIGLIGHSIWWMSGTNGGRQSRLHWRVSGPPKLLIREIVSPDNFQTIQSSAEHTAITNLAEQLSRKLVKMPIKTSTESS